MNQLEDCFEKGLAHFKSGNYSEAVRWYRKAAEQGNRKAQYWLGISYLGGHGIASDNLMAFHWINKAAEQGDGDSLCFLGACSVDGLKGFIQRDMTEAYKFFIHAHAAGQENADGWIKLLHASLSPQELAEGEQRAREYCIQPTQPS